MSASDIIAECIQGGVDLTPALDFDGPDDAFAGDLEQRLRDHKVEVIRELVGRTGIEPRGGPAGPDWRFEWLREMGIVALRWREATDLHVKALLRELLDETPKSLDEWLILGGMIRDAEVDLRRAGKLPQIPNFGP
jgi:hypothetical protein